MSTELVPVENMAAVEALDPQAREAAVTHMLSEARAWLAHAVETTGPQSIAQFKAQMATVAEATKQLNLSKEIQLDAQEMVRRAERCVGLAIRKGQAEGTVAKRGQGAAIPPGARSRSDHDLVTVSSIAPTHELVGVHGEGGIYAVTDGVTDEQFDAAIETAKDEGNLSRANVVRKVRGARTQTKETSKDAMNLAIPQPPKYGGNRLKCANTIANAINTASGACLALDGIKALDGSISREEAASYASDLSNVIRSLKRIQSLLTKEV